MFAVSPLLGSDAGSTQTFRKDGDLVGRITDEGIAGEGVLRGGKQDSELCSSEEGTRDTVDCNLDIENDESLERDYFR